VHILAPGVIDGNIKTPKLIIEEGVTFDGKCEMAGQKKATDQKVVSLAERQ
jgi:cytoskeletal protein CcmA (bactofilin family)